jgi:hypothetical protein
VESSERETGEALMRLSVLALGAALDVLRLMLAERSADPKPIGGVFDTGQQACLEHLAPTLEGTGARANPHPVGTMAWGAWLIARLGGWSGYRSQRRAGPATYHEGLRRFAWICQGWHLSDRDLYKP